MAVAELCDALSGVTDLILRRDEPLAHHVPLRVGGPADLWAEASTLTALEAFTAAARATGTRWRLHWPFSDWLVRDGGLQGAVLRLGGEFDRIEVSDESVTIGAAALWASLPSSLQGGLWDAIRTWPGSVGDLIHSGTARHLSELVTSLQVLRGGRVVDLSWSDGDDRPKLGENTILIAITMRKASAARTWLESPPAPGTLFADIENTQVSKELRRAGVLGTRLRNWRLSDVEPGTVIHLGMGGFSDLSLLIKGVKVRVEKTRGVTLEPRIPILGSNRKTTPRSLHAAALQRDSS
jgi:UDP-N-acetylmuramate dehydrogenase